MFFFKPGPIAGNGIAVRYLATFTWGAWILAAGWVMWGMLGRAAQNLSADREPAGSPA